VTRLIILRWFSMVTVVHIVVVIFVVITIVLARSQALNGLFATVSAGCAWKHMTLLIVPYDVLGPVLPALMAVM
jgi:hypothetical protein